MPCVHGPVPLPTISTPASRSRHPGGVNAGFGDGSVRFIKDTINPVIWIGPEHDPGRRGPLVRFVLTPSYPLRGATDAEPASRPDDRPCPGRDGRPAARRRTSAPMRPTRPPTTRTPPRPAAVPELRHERFRIGDKLGEGGMGVVYRARDTPRRPRGRAQAHEGLAGRHGPAPLRARVPLALGPAPPALPERLRLRRARRRPVLHHGAVPGPADHQPGRPRRRGRARPPAPGDAGARLHPPPGHRPPRRQAVEHPRPTGDPPRRLARLRGQADGLRPGQVLRREVVAVGRGRLRRHGGLLRPGADSTTTSSTTAPTSTAWDW